MDLENLKRNWTVHFSAYEALVDKTLEEPGVLVDPELFDSIKSFIKYFDILKEETKNKLVDLLVEAFSAFLSSISKDSETGGLSEYKNLLERFAFLLHWTMDQGERLWKKQKLETESVVVKKTTKKAKTVANEWNWNGQKEKIVKLFLRMVQLDLKRIIVSGSDRNTLLSMVSKSVTLIMDEPENVKSTSLRLAMFQIWAIGVKEYDQGLSIQTKIMQSLREEHLSEPLAQFLHVLVAEYDAASLAENILRDIKDIEFTDKDIKGSKAMASFLVKLSELNPKLVLRQLVYLQEQIESDSYTIRCCMMEVLGHLICHVIANGAQDNALQQISSFYELLQIRLMDTSSYVRSKVLQVLIRLAEVSNNEVGVSNIPLAVRMDLMKQATGRLRDKSSNVRKNAIRFLIKMIETCPFTGPAADKGQLNLKLFNARMDQLNAVVAEKEAKQLRAIEAHCEDDEMEGGEKESVAPTGLSEAEQLELKSTNALLRYYTDAIKFCTLLQQAGPTLNELLSSNIKTEIIEVMNLFVLAFSRSMEFAEEGVRLMVHKIWDKETTEKEGGNVRDHLAICYEKLYVVDEEDQGDGEGASPEVCADATANNLIQ